jgi:hypothetical protein
MSHFHQRTKTLTVFAPCCGARMTVEYDGTGSGWERSTDLPNKCPNGHRMDVDFNDIYIFDMKDALHSFIDERAIDGVGDISEADLCGYDKAER